MYRHNPLLRRSSMGRSVADFIRLSAQTDARQERHAVLITGAGVSTASGIPDYRGPEGLYEKGHRPMTFQHFTSGLPAQRRYYARSFLGYPTMCLRKPNPAHTAIAALLGSGAVSHVITQNVDGLHPEAIRVAEGAQGLDQFQCRSNGHPKVSELHGNIHRVRCLQCRTITTRAELQSRLAEANRDLLLAYPALAKAAILPHDTNGAAPHSVGEASDSVLELASEKPKARDMMRLSGVTPVSIAASSSPVAATTQPPSLENSPLRPDGDFEATQGWIDEFQIVPCASCGEFKLKPDMVFFGESTDPEVVKRCFTEVEKASCVLCIGTSMQVFSAYRFVLRARDRGVPVAVLNMGDTRADKDAALKVEGPVHEVLPYVALRLQDTVSAM
jgi:NAD-dependent deacetylase sirtuin 4